MAEQLYPYTIVLVTPEHLWPLLEINNLDEATGSYYTWAVNKKEAVYRAQMQAWMLDAMACEPKEYMAVVIYHNHAVEAET